jgi:hypothetical protein
VPMKPRTVGTSRMVRALGLTLLIAVQAWSAASPSGTSAAPVYQVVAEDPDEAWRRAELAQQQAAQAVSAWPAAYPFYRPRPPYPGGALQQLFPWQMLGSPYLPALPFREIHFTGNVPSPHDLCYGRLVRSYNTPLVFRLNYLAAAPYINFGYGPAVLEAWWRYLSPPPTAGEAAATVEDAIGLVGGCYAPEPSGDVPLAGSPPAAPSQCGRLEPPPTNALLSAEEMTIIIGNWLRQCGYLVDTGPLPYR